MSEAVKALFGRIATRYDLLNRVLSLRRDVAWRRAALALVEGPPGVALDLACGTFDLGLEALAYGKAMQVHGCDFCLPMLEAGAKKRAGLPLSASVGDASHLPFADASCDLVMVAYGWRNFPDAAESLREIRRVLKPGGQLLVLEFFRPERRWPRLFYATFGRVVFPALGGLLAGDASAYRYLNDSIARFLSVAEADDLLVREGFPLRRWLPFFGGVSHAVVAKRT